MVQNHTAGGDAMELQAIQDRSNQVVDESLESTRRMLALCEESQDAGAKTLNMLDQQGEQLDRIDEGMDHINADMREAEKNLTGMEKCCGLCALPCSKTSEFKEDTSTWKGNEDGKVVNSQPRQIEGGNGNLVPPKSGFVTRITNDAREDEMEDNLGQVSSIVGNLKNMAIDMGSEISSQNATIDRINAKAESNELRITTANERAVKILKS